MDKFKKLKIPIPSLKKQEDIINNIEKLNNKNRELENEIEQNKLEAKLIMSSIKKIIIDDVKDDLEY